MNLHKMIQNAIDSFNKASIKIELELPDLSPVLNMPMGDLRRSLISEEEAPLGTIIDSTAIIDPVLLMRVSKPLPEKVEDLPHMLYYSQLGEYADRS